MKKVLIYLVLLTVVSCGKKTVFEKERIFQNNTWNRFEKVNFEFPVEKENGYYQIKLVVKHDGKFEDDIFPVYVTLNTSSGEERMKEIRFMLKEKEMLQGEKQADYYAITKDLWKTILISEKGNCTVSIENIYPKYDSYGIHSISLLVDKTEKPKPEDDE